MIPGLFYVRIYQAIILALVVVGINFSKFPVIGPLYLHDLVLVLTVFSVLFSLPRKWPFPTILVLILLSIVYFIISLLSAEAPVVIIIRQYAIFGYLTLYYILFVKGATYQTERGHSNFLILTGLLSCAIQVIFVTIKMVKGVSVLDDYNYYSPAIILGIIIAGTAVLVYPNSVLVKLVAFAALGVLSTTTGHSSAALSLMLVGGAYVLFQIDGKSKQLVITAGVLGLLALYVLLPQFHDNNAGFRLIAWSHTVKRIVVDQFGLWGEGFGILYFDRELVLELYDKVGSTGFFGIEHIEEGYLSSVHNSFLTIFLSVGLLPGLLILFPFVRLVLYLRVRRTHGKRYADFVFLSLIGLSTWVAFNEILELPHSAALYWLVYFCAMAVRWEKTEAEVT